MAHTPRHEPPAQPAREADRDGRIAGLREVPALPIRFGRHLTAWLLWHTSRVSLVADVPPPQDLDRTARA